VSEQNRNDWELEWEFLVAEAWADDVLMERLLSRPADVLTERGFPLPEGVSTEVVREPDVARIRFTAPDGNVLTLVLPPRPNDGEISESHLEVMASGKCGCGGGGVWVGWGGGGFRCGIGCGFRCGGRCGVGCGFRCGRCRC